jgi:hypothetical protein
MPATIALPVRRDCNDCGLKGGMKLQNVAPSNHIATLYICERCGTQLTIPPPFSPLR